jgi:hypothetical protein
MVVLRPWCLPKRTEEFTKVPARTETTGLFKMIHPISNDYIFEIYKYRVISDT